MSRQRLTYGECLEEAKKFTKLINFANANGGMYQTILANKWIDDIVKDAGLIRRAKNGTYSYKSVLKIAKGFKTVYGWRTNNRHSYNWAKRYGHAKAIIEELNLLTTYFDENEFTFDECLEDAKKFNNVGDWKKSGTTYKFCKNKEWVEEIGRRVGYKKGSRKKLWWYDLL